MTALMLLALLLVPAAARADAGREYFYESPLRPYFEADPARPGWLRAARAGSSAAPFRKDKPAGTLRVFVVGGSIAAMHQDHPAALPRLLAASLPGREVEVINCGQGGYESERESGVLREALRYAPDLVVLMTGHNERDDAPLLPLWRLRLAALALRTGLIRPPPPREVDDARRAALAGAFARRVDGMLAAAAAAGVPVLVVLPPLNAEAPVESSWPSGAAFLEGWRHQLAGRRGAARAAWAPLLKEGGRGAATAAVLAAAGLAAEGKAGQARALALDALDRRPLFGGHCSRSCRDTLSRLAALHGMTAADVDGAFRAAALPLYPGWSDFDDAVHWNTARHALAMETVVAAARRVPGLKGLPWKDAAIRAKLPADGTRTLYAFSALTRASPEGPPPAAVLALERALREDPKALDGGRDALLARVSGRGGFLAAWGGRLDVRPAAWDWAEGLARLQAGDAAGALAPLRSAASAHPGRPEPRLHLAAALLRAGRAAEADAELERLLDGAGDRTRELALAGLALGSRSPALREAAKPPLEERLAALRARALSLQLRDPAAALPLFDELLAARPGDADLLADRGVCRALAGRKPDAEADLRAALRARPGHKAAEASLHALGLKP